LLPCTFGKTSGEQNSLFQRTPALDKRKLPMINPSMTIETVHGLKETVTFSNFTVGPMSSKKEDKSEREPRDRKDSTERDELQR